MSQKSHILEMLEDGECTTHLIRSRFGVHAIRKLRALRSEGYQIETTRLSLSNFSYKIVDHRRAVPTHPRRVEIIMPVAASEEPLRSSENLEMGSYEYWQAKRREINKLVWL
jgi:hypothetical protein